MDKTLKVIFIRAIAKNEVINFMEHLRDDVSKTYANVCSKALALEKEQR